MSDGADRVLMFHGTSTACLHDIMANGMTPTPPVRLSVLEAEAKDTGGAHLASFDGTYMTVAPYTAGKYAESAVKHFGGDPVVVAFSVPVADLVPDEDEVLFALGVPLAYGLGWDAENPEKPLEGWSEERAMQVAGDIVGQFAVPDPEAASKVARCLDRMVSAAIGPDWDRDPLLFDPEANENGWGSPNWVRRLTSTSEGMALYRFEMDAMCRAMSGADPWHYPCDLESCKGRIASRIGFGEGRECFIVSIGSPAEPRRHYDDVASLTGREIADLGAREWLGENEPAMAM